MGRKAIVLTKFPFADISSTKGRPVLVLISPKSHKSDFIAAFIFSVIPSQIEESDFVMDESDQNFERTGLVKTSMFKMDKLATLDKSIFSDEVAEVSD